MNETNINKKTSIKEISNVVLNINNNIFNGLFTIKKYKNILIFEIDDVKILQLVVRKNGVSSRLSSYIHPNHFSFWLEFILMNNIAINIVADNIECEGTGQYKTTDFYKYDKKCYNEYMKTKNWFYRYFLDPRKHYEDCISDEKYKILMNL
jgi:hypothetical protein